MSQRESLEVRMDDRLVGTLALTANHKVAFSYSEEWLEHGFSVSPFSLPLKNEVFVPKKDYFDGLFGVFAAGFRNSFSCTLALYSFNITVR